LQQLERFLKVKSSQVMFAL